MFFPIFFHHRTLHPGKIYLVKNKSKFLLNSDKNILFFCLFLLVSIYTRLEKMSGGKPVIYNNIFSHSSVMRVKKIRFMCSIRAKNLVKRQIKFICFVKILVIKLLLIFQPSAGHSCLHRLRSKVENSTKQFLPKIFSQRI